jgi:hypothetical protein
MDLKSLSREEIEERLKDRSNKQLSALASEQGLRLPTGLNIRVAILDAIHEALGAKTSAPASGDPPSPGSAPRDVHAPEAGKRFADAAEGTISVLCVTRFPAFWRYGHCFTNDWQDIPISTFDEHIWRKIRFENTKTLRSRGYPPGFAEKV